MLKQGRGFGFCTLVCSHLAVKIPNRFGLGNDQIIPYFSECPELCDIASNFKGSVYLGGN